MDLLSELQSGPLDRFVSSHKIFYLQLEEARARGTEEVSTPPVSPTHLPHPSLLPLLLFLLLLHHLHLLHPAHSLPSLVCFFLSSPLFLCRISWSSFNQLKLFKRG